MAWFRRRPRGRHALGAAVTEIPSAPVRLSPAPVVSQPVGEPDLLTSIAELIATGEAWNAPADASSSVEAPLTRSASSSGHPRAAPDAEPARRLGAVLAEQVVAHEAPGLETASYASAPLDEAHPGWPGIESVPVEPLAFVPLAFEPLVFEPAALQQPLVEPPAVEVLAEVADVEPGLLAWAETFEGSGVPSELPSGPPLVADDASASFADPELPAAGTPVLPVAADPVTPLSRELPAAQEVTAADPVLAHPALSSLTVPVQGGPRIELGFRDGTTASLDPDSEQALRLAEISELLNARD